MTDEGKTLSAVQRIRQAEQQQTAGLRHRSMDLFNVAVVPLLLLLLITSTIILSHPAKQQGRKAIPTNTHFRYDVHRIDPASYATAHHTLNSLQAWYVAAGRDLPPQKN